MNRLLPVTLAVTIFGILGAGYGFSQTVTATITGTITDPTGAAIPDVSVIATQLGTNLTYTATSNPSGRYNLLFLPNGEYTLSATASGFKKATAGPLTLDVGQTARLDIAMTLGEIAQSVEVSATATILQTESAQTGDTITASQAAALLNNGRQFSALTLLVPGAITPASTDFTSVSRGGGRPFVNGNREQSNNFLLDGVDINESMDNGIGYNPSVDALAEVKVVTGNASAEFGNANGAVVNAAMKSGGNQFHGNLFEFLRNDKLDANDFFVNRAGGQKRALRRNIWGGTLGGPIRKDRAFFFMDYQGARNRSSGSVVRTQIPESFLRGDLSMFLSPNLATSLRRYVKDPTLTGNCNAADQAACFPGNIIPASRIVNPVAKSLLASRDLYPAPNHVSSSPNGYTGNYLSSNGSFTDNDQADIKIDTRFSDKDHVSGRFTIARYRSGNGATEMPLVFYGANDSPTTLSVLNWTRTISPNAVNEFRVGYSRIRSLTGTQDVSGLVGINGNQKLGIAGGQPIAGVSRITVGDGMDVFGTLASDSGTTDNQYQYGNNLTVSHGRHLLKMGGQLLRYQQNRFYAGNNGLLGYFTYTGQYTGSGVGDFLLNMLQSKGRGSQTGTWGHRQWRVATFFQDDFKITPALTLNLGLRWEFTQPVYEVADRQASIDLATGQELFAGKNGNSRALYNSYYKQFMPRVGLAWSPQVGGRAVVIRGAYGITSYLEGTGGNLRLPLNPPFFYESDVTYDLRSPGNIATGFTDVAGSSAFAGQIRYWDKNLRPAFIQQWNVSLERQFSNTISVSLAYVGQKGNHLIDPREYNQPLPGSGASATWQPLQNRRPLFAAAPLVTNISGTDSSSNMFYNSMQFSVRKRLSAGLELLTSYTFSKTLTDNRGFYGKSGFVQSEGAYWQNAFDRHGDWGRAFFDATHNYSLGGSYALPFGNKHQMGAQWSKPVDMILGGWTANYIVSMHSGFPITLLANDSSNQSVRGFTRPDRFGDLNYSGQSVDTWFGNTNSFCLTAGQNDGKCSYGQPAAGKFGNSGKGTGQAPAFSNVNLAIGKQFHISEARYLDFRAEFFNAFNHPSLGPPNNTINQTTTFGTITRVVNEPRNVQLGLKYYF